MKNVNDLVSVCVVWENQTSNSSSEILRDLSKKISDDYEYFEILLLIHETDFRNISEDIQDIKNLRSIVLRTHSNHYEKRSICARESIGDIVIISTLNEIELFELNHLIDLLLSENCIVVSKKKKLTFFETIFISPLRLVGKIVGLQINLSLSRTIAFPRTSLNLILSQEYVDLKLRFPPRNLDVKIKTVPLNSVINKSYSDMESKSALLYMLLLNFTPFLLRQLTFISGLGIFFSSSYFLYAIFVYLFMQDIQSGWFSLSIAISGTALFLTTSIFILSIGIQHLIANSIDRSSRNASYEVDNVNLFKNTENNLNIELSGEDESSDK